MPIAMACHFMAATVNFLNQLRMPISNPSQNKKSCFEVVEIEGI
jgi:hypothetical protein